MSMAMSPLWAAVHEGTERVLSDGVVYAYNRPVGILRPTTLEGVGPDGAFYVHGVDGLAKVIDVGCSTTVFEALIASGAILFGSEDQVFEVRRWLVDPVSSRTASYLACVAETCQSLLHALAIIRSARILVIGCGGIGSLVSAQLAGAGVLHLTLVDGDRVEQSNLNRQLVYSGKDVGRLKVKVLQERLLERFDVGCRVVSRRIESDDIDSIAPGHVAGVLTADEPIGLGTVGLQERADRADMVWVGAGYVHTHALVRLAVPGSAASWNEGSTFRMRRPTHFIGGSFGPLNVEIAGHAAGLLLHTLCFAQSRERGTRAFSWCPWNRSLRGDSLG